MAKLPKKYSSQGIDNASYNETFGLKEVISYGWDGSQPVALKVDSLGNIQQEDSPLGAPTTTNVTLTNADTDYKLPTNELAGRRTLVVTNNSDTNVYLGQTGVIDCDATPPIGILLPPNGTLTIDCSTGMYAQCDTAGKKLTVTEF